MVEDARQEPEVARDPEEAEPDDEQAGDRAGAEGDVERRAEPRFRSLRGADVRAHGDVHADEARRARENRADREADRRSPAQLVVEAEQQERDDRDGRDRHVLPPQVRRRAFLDGARDLLHPLAARRLLQQPPREVQPESDRDARTDERESNRVVIEEIHQASVSNPRHKVSAELRRRGGVCITSVGRARFRTRPRRRSRRRAGGSP